MKKIIIASISDNNVIGKGNIIPWYIPGDLKHFKETTLGYPVVMGCHTFFSIGKTLDQRFNIVLSKNHREELRKHKSLFVCHDIDDALAAALNFDFEQIFLIGGEEIFNQTINLVDEMIISRIPLSIEGDKFFPVISEDIWLIDKSIQKNNFKIDYYVKRNEK